MTPLHPRLHHREPQQTRKGVVLCTLRCADGGRRPAKEMDRLPESTRSMRKYASEAGGLRAARQGPHGRSLTARTAHSMSTTALRTKSKSAASLLRRVPFAPLRPVLANLQEVFLGTKLAVLFPAVPLAIAAQCAHFGQVINQSIPHSLHIDPRTGSKQTSSMWRLAPRIYSSYPARRGVSL